MFLRLCFVIFALVVCIVQPAWTQVANLPSMSNDSILGAWHTEGTYGRLVGSACSANVRINVVTQTGSLYARVSYLGDSQPCLDSALFDPEKSQIKDGHISLVLASGSHYELDLRGTELVGVFWFHETTGGEFQYGLTFTRPKGKT